MENTKGFVPVLDEKELEEGKMKRCLGGRYTNFIH